MSDDPILIRVLVHTYPAAWRRQYGDEYAALLIETLGPVRWFRRPVIIANVLRGVLDARLRSQGGVHMSTRSPLSVAVWATGLFTVAGIGFQKLSENQAPAGQHPLIALSFDALLVAAALALAAIVVAAVPAAIAMAKGRANGAVPLLAVPPVAVALWYGLLRVAFLIAGHQPVHSVRNIAAAALVIVGGVAVVVATAWAAAAVLRRVDAGPARWQPTLMAVLTLGMGVGTLACLGWGLALRAADPGAFAARDGLLATPFLPSWIGNILVMAAATALAARAIRRRPTAVAR